MMLDGCAHLDLVGDVVPASLGCAACVAIGDEWVNLRLCMTCGHVGCCDASKNRHASGHFADVGHPVIQSFEPGDDWWYCYIDSVSFSVPDAPSLSY
jgi:uncharacterized UBP type Zn finger protein